MAIRRIRTRRTIRAATGLLSAVALLLLAGCSTPRLPAPPAPSPVVPPTPPARVTAPLPRPDQAGLRAARATAARKSAMLAAAPSPASQRIAAYLQGAQNQLLAQGKLRTDRTPADAPFDAARLARSFAQIALRDEYSRDGTRLVADGHSAPLRRWSVPVRIQPVFGPSAPAAARIRDRHIMTDIAARLTRASTHPVSLTAEGGNFAVLILTEDERRSLDADLIPQLADIPQGDLAAIRALAPGNFCTVFAYARGETPAYVQAVALIRAELPDRLRASCFEEELAQGMGLANDSPAARPSVFNDDEEFALLTRHDELLLQILYDPRLSPGMTQATAQPIIDQIAAELAGGTEAPL